MLRNRFTVAPFEQSPYSYRSGLVEIRAHKDFMTDFFTYDLVKGQLKSREIEAFLWAFKDFFRKKSEVRHYCCGKTFIRKTRMCRTYGVVIEGKKFKYNVRITDNTDLFGVNFYIVVNKKADVEAA